MQLNATKLEPVTFGDFTSWLSSAFSFFKEWVGVGIFGLCCIFGIIICLWLVCRMRVRAHRDKVLLTQALLAVSEGDSPAAWISVLNNSNGLPLHGEALLPLHLYRESKLILSQPLHPAALVGIARRKVSQTCQRKAALEQ